MPAPHIIRLRGPWEFRTATACGRVSLPGDWLQGHTGEPAAIAFTRRFNRPSNLEAGTRVELATSDLPEGVKVRLNQQPLSSVATNRYELTPHLLAQNTLEITFTTTPEQTLFAEVWLEIHA